MLKKCIYMLIFLIIPFLIPKEYGHASASTADNMEVKGVWTVSYTHLDVYKRQVRNISALMI